MRGSQRVVLSTRLTHTISNTVYIKEEIRIGSILYKNISHFSLVTF